MAGRLELARRTDSNGDPSSLGTVRRRYGNIGDLDRQQFRHHLQPETVWLAELLIAVAAFCWLRSAVLYRPGAAETIVGAGMLCYTAGLADSVVLNYWASEGAGIAALPWYVEAMKPAATCLLCLGLWRARAFGRAVSVLMICLWTYMIAATYVLKLIPFYSGFSGTVRAGAVWSHYSGSTWQEILADTAMGSPTTILCFTAAVVLLAVTLAVLLSRKALLSQGS